VRLDGDRYGRVDARQLLDADQVREVVGSRAAVVLRDREAEKALLSAGEEDVGRKLLALVVARRLGGDLALDEGPNDLAELLVLGCER
jgi:hypothetical protein